MIEGNSEMMAGEPGFEPGPTESESGDNLTKSTPVRHNSAPVHGDTNQCVSVEVSNFGAGLCGAASEPPTSALRTQRYSLKLAEYCGFAWLQRVLVTTFRNLIGAKAGQSPRRTLRSGVA